MQKLQLIVAVKEAAYLSRLADYIHSRAFGKEWQLTAFTQASALRQYMKSGYPIDLLAAQPAFLDKLDDVLPGRLPVAVLVSSAAKAKPKEELDRGRAAIRQFQALPQLLQELTAVHAAGLGGDGGAVRRSGREACVMAVYSAAGGIGKSTLAVQLARQAGWKEQRVFYLNLEAWNASALWSESGGEEDFSQLLYAVQVYPERAAAILAKLRRRHQAMKFDYIAPCSNASERLAMSGEDAGALIGAIAQSGQYDLVVVDLDCGADEVHRAVFEEADYLLWLLARDAVTLHKTEMALDAWEAMGREALQSYLRKTQFIAAYSSDLSMVKLGHRSLRIFAGIPFVSEWAQGRNSREQAEQAVCQGLLDQMLNRLAGSGTGEERLHGVRNARTAAQSQYS